MSWRLACAGLVLSACAQAGPAMLEVADEGGEVLRRFALADGERWCLLWRHSVAGFEVRDCFAWRAPRLLLTDSRQPDFAAGLGHAEGRGTLRADAAGGYRIDGIDLPVPDNRLLLRVGSAAVDHRVEIGGGVHSLSAGHAGRRLVLSVIEAPPAPDANTLEKRR